MSSPGSPPSRAWRMPLQTGEAALRALWVGALLWLPAVALALATLIVLWALDLDGDFAGWVMAPAALLGFFCWKQLKRAWDLRPSDLELTTTGFRVHGGPHDGFALDYARLSGAHVQEGRAESASLTDSADDFTDLHALWVHDLKNRGTALAKASSTAERASLEDVAATLMEARRATPAQKEAPKHEVLRCAQCQGPVAPSPDATTVCPWCSQAVDVPQATRDKVKAAQTLALHPAKAVERVLSQTPAHVIDLQYRAIALVMLAAWPIATAVFAYNLSKDSSTWGSIGLLALFILGTVCGALAVFRTRLTERQALRLLTVRFTALAPEGEGKPRRCRSCLGPLAEAGQAALVTCAWCDAPNVLGVDYRLQARAAVEEAQSLEDVLKRRALERRLWGGLGAAGLLMLVGSVWALLAAMGKG